MARYHVYANIDQMAHSLVSRHRSLAAAGRAYQAAHTGNLRRVIARDARDVTVDAIEAANKERR